MKLCVTASNNDLESRIDPRFGRCSYFIIYDTSNDTFDAVANPNIDADFGAGVQSAQLVISKKAAAIITGELGPKAKKVLQMSGLQIIIYQAGSVKEAIEKYKNNIAMDDGVKNNEENIQTKPGVMQKFIGGCFDLGNKLGMRHRGKKGLKTCRGFGRNLGRS